MITLVITIGALIAVAIGMYIITKIQYFNKDVFRFILTGGFNTFNYYLMYLILFEFLNLPYIYAHVSAFLYSAFCSFFITTMYTFGERPTVRKFVAFPITFLPNLVISTLVTKILVDNQILSETYASLIAMFLAIPITFVVSKIVITGNLKQDKA